MANKRTHTITVLWVVLAVLLFRCTPSMVTPDPFATADTYVATGEYTAAETAYRAIAEAAPEDPRPALRLADLYRRWNRPQAGLAALDDAVECGIRADAVAALRLELLAMTGNWAKVEDQASLVLASAPDDPTALKLLAQAYAHQHQCDAAIDLATRWHAVDGQNPEATRLWGALTGDPVSLCEVDAGLCDAVQACKDTCDLRLGLALIRSADWPLAACALKKAVEAHPTSAEAHTWLGEALVRLGYSEEARLHLTQATALAPESPLAWLLLGVLDLSEERTNEAQDAIYKAHVLDPSNPAPCLAMAEAIAQKGNYDDITPWMEAAVAIAPSDTELWKAVARFYLERHLTGRTGGSTEAYVSRAVLNVTQLAPNDGEAWMLLGWFRLMQGDVEGALTALDEAVAFAPNLGQAHYLRGQALQTVGRKEEARRATIRANDLGYVP